MTNTQDLLWPDVTKLSGARTAMTEGAACALIVAGATGAIGVYALFNGPILGLNWLSIGDALVVAIVGWRILARSRVWAVIGLVYWLSSVIVSFQSDPPTNSAQAIGKVIGILILLGFVNGVRGTFALEKFRKQVPIPPAPDSLAPLV